MKHLVERLTGSFGVWLLVTMLVSVSSAFPAETPHEAQPSRGVGCLGRITPIHGILHIAQPASSFPGISPISQLKVKEGDLVKKGEVIAVLENKLRLETAWKAAVAQGVVAESRLAQVRAGASRAELAAQEAEVGRAEAELDAARINHERSEKLRKDAAIADLAFQNTRLIMATRQKQFEAASQKLKSLSEVREVDVLLAQAQHQAALAEAERTKAELDQAFIVAPADGRIVRVNARPGERIGPEGIVELAELGPLYVIAEVHESDLPRIRIGHHATVTGTAFTHKPKGLVEQIGLKVGRNNLFGTDRATSEDARVVEVRIRLDETESAALLLDARVTVVIQP